jgi:HEAT repeat protein
MTAGSGPIGNLCNALGGLDQMVGIDALKRIATKSTANGVRWPAIYGFLKAKTLGPGQASFLVSRATADSDSGVRVSCVRVLQQLHQTNETIATALEPLLVDPNPDVRLALCAYLTDWSDPKSIPMWRALLKDNSSVVRAAACEGLGHFMVDDAVPELLERLADSNEDVRKKAKDVLERIRFYNEEKKRWQDWKRAGGLDPAEGIQRLAAMLDDNDAAVRVAAIQSLGSMKAKEALPKLVDLMKKASGAEREELSKAIAKISQ